MLVKMVHFHFYTKLVDPSLAKLDLCFPGYDIWMVFQGPLDLHAHDSWSMCKAALRQIIVCPINHMTR